MSIGTFVRETISNNSALSTEEILAKVRDQFPEAKTTASCVAWYKSDMRKKGLLGGGRVKAVMVVDPKIKAQQELDAATHDLENLTNKQWIKDKVQSLKLQIEDLKAELEALNKEEAATEVEA